MINSTLKRRDFLKFSALAVAAPAIVPASVLGSTETPPPSERAVLGHIGVGGQGSGLLRNCLNLKNARSVAVLRLFCQSAGPGS